MSGRLLCQFSRSIRARNFSTDTFGGVLRQISQRPDTTGSIPFQPGNGGDTFSEEKHVAGTEIGSFVSSLDSSESQSSCSLTEHVTEDPPNTDQIAQDVVNTIQELLEAQNVWTGGLSSSSATLDDPSLTPAQRFYLENKDLLLKRTADYSVNRALNDFERATKDIEDDWVFYRDPVVRPSKGHLWPATRADEQSDSSSSSVEFESNKFPEIEEIVHLLRQEKVEDITTLDLELCGRRDIGEYAIVGTVSSYLHGDRVGSLARRAVMRLGLENVKCFSNAIPGQEWIVIRLGPVVVHLMTPADRLRYNLEALYAINPTEEITAALDAIDTTEAYPHGVLE